MDQINQASQLFQNRQFEQAENVLNDILKKQPDHYHALQLLALVEYSDNKPELGLELIEKAHQLRAEDKLCLQNAIKIAAKCQRYDRVVYFYQQLILQEPNNQNLYDKLAHLYFDLACYQDCIDLLKNKMASFKQQAALYSLLGRAYDRTCQFEQAHQAFMQALQIDPEEPTAITQLAWIALRHENEDELQKILHYKVKDPKRKKKILTDIAFMLDYKGRFDEAEVLLDSVLTEHPDYIGAQISIAAIYFKQGNLEKAEQAILTTLDQYPNDVHVLNALAMFYQKSGMLDKSNSVFKKIINLDPYYANAHHSLGINYLKQGDFKNGWQEWEWRPERRGLLMLNGKHIPYWQGEDLSNKTLYIAAEQGIGDEILFASLIHKLAPKAKKCIMTCTEKLLPLMRRSFPDIEVVVNTAKVDASEIDCGIFMASMPLYFFQQESDFPKQKSFINADPEKVDAWKNRLGDQFKIGFSWRAAAVPMSDAFDTARRSIPLEEWLPLFARKDAQFVNLQYGDVSEELKAFNKKNKLNLFFDKDIDFFDEVDELAACIEACDLVITVDNSTAHLAGALGKKTCVLLPKVCNWRWFEGRDDSLWYPSVKLIRQTLDGDWQDVILRTTSVSA